jgi:tetratricopeptide (TPR) repeat protein
MRPSLWLLVLGICAMAACARPAVAPVDRAVASRSTLAAADALVRAGCFDCLADALKQYESIRQVPAVSELATAGAVRAAGLLALRERELGTTDSGYLKRARELAATSATVGQNAAPLLDFIAIMPWRAGLEPLGASDPVLSLYQNRERRVEMLRPLAVRDELSAYVWLANMCATSSVRMEKSEFVAPIGALSNLPLLAFRQAICLGADAVAVEALVEREPRFAELAFFRGVVAGGALKLEDADARYREAYAWRATWPAATIAIANLAMTAEEFASALDFYDRTLTLAPSYPDALLGKLRALTVLARHDEALGVADELLALRRYPGDAYYWRAYNELQLERLDRAWDDIESADKAMVNSDVPKLAGIIEMRRRVLDVARQKLELSRERNRADCETSYYLHLVLADQGRWDNVVGVAVGTADCLDGAEAYARQQIAQIAASSIPEARKARQIARREQQIASAVRMRATCWFNAAVANFNLSKPAEARRFAEKVDTDEQFGQRARDLLTRLAK